MVAEWDRLSRGMAFVATLIDSVVEFVAGDNPCADRLTVHILCAVAEDGARRIGERTRVARQGWPRALRPFRRRAQEQHARNSQPPMHGSEIMRRRKLTASRKKSAGREKG